MRASSKGLLTQISQFWNMLDDLAENDPERYKNFIKQELKDGKQLCVDPEPQLCLQTKILKPKEKVLFINLCQWKRIPAPQSANHPVPISVGRPEDFSEASGSYTVIDVAYNPDVLQAAGKDQGIKDQLIKMAMHCIEEQLQFTLARSYHVTSFSIKGNIQRTKENLTGIKTDFTGFKEIMRTENTLEMMRGSTESEPNHLPQGLLNKKQASGKGRCLIEEISSSEIQVEVKKPAYELKIVKDQNEKPLKIELKIKLPGINSVSLCELTVSEVDLLIEVSEKYRLYLNLPESINTEMTTAKFVKNNLQCNLGWLGAKEEVPARSCDSGTAAGRWWTIWSVTCAPSDNEHLETGSTLMKHFKFQRMDPHITYKDTGQGYFKVTNNSKHLLKHITLTGSLEL